MQISTEKLAPVGAAFFMLAAAAGAIYVAFEYPTIAVGVGCFIAGFICRSAMGNSHIR